MIKRRTGRWLQKERERWFKRKPFCVICFAHTPPRLVLATELDHIVPLHKGGKDIASNKQGLCDPCHLAKSILERGRQQAQKVGLDGYPIEDESSTARSSQNDH